MPPLLILCIRLQVSSVTDHVGAQDPGTKAADFDDDDGGGLVSQNLTLLINTNLFGVHEISVT